MMSIWGVVDTQSIPFKIGQIVGALFVLALPILFAVCLVFAIRKRSPGWIVASVMTGIPAAAFIGLFTYGMVIGFLNGVRASQGKSSEFHHIQETKVKGTDYDYTIEVPNAAKWRINRTNLNFDLETHYRDVYVGIMAERINGTDNQQIYINTRNRISKLDPNSTISNPVEIQIDDLPWLYFEVMVEYQKIKFAYAYYVHSSAAGTYQIMGWTGQNLFEKEKGSIDKIARSFRLGESIKASLKNTPTPTPTPAPSAEPVPSTSTEQTAPPLEAAPAAEHGETQSIPNA